MPKSDIAAYILSFASMICAAVVFIDQLVTGPNSVALPVALGLGIGCAIASVYVVKRRPFD